MKIEYNQYSLGKCGTSAIPIKYEKINWDDGDLKEYLITFDNGYVLDIDSYEDERFIKDLIKNKIRIYIDFELAIQKDSPTKTTTEEKKC